MRAAFYARYSTDKQKDTSPEDQFRNCERLAKREGWTIGERYEDRAMSGANSNRPDYLRMHRDALAGKFDVLVVDDLSRLSRDEIEFKTTIRSFNFRGVRIVGVSDGFDSSAKGHKVQATVRGLMNEIYLDDLREKTHRGLMGCALKGQNTGGRVYGYDSVRIEDPARRDERGHPVVLSVTRAKNPEQAKWVRQIFEWYADGRSPQAIAAELNKLRVPAPRSKTWARTAIYGDHRTGTGMLNNEIYIGRVHWNRAQWIKDPDTQRVKRVPRPKSEWVVREDPELRIVEQALWNRVKARQRQVFSSSIAIREALGAQARTGAGPKYLFSGVLKCGTCGANYIVCNATHYGCSTNVNRGPAACANGIRVSRKLVEARLLDGIKRDLFTPEAIDLFKRETSRRLAERRRVRAASDSTQHQRLQTVTDEIANMIAAIKAGAMSDSLKAELENSEKERATLVREMDATTRAVEQIADELPDAVERYRKLVANLEQATSRDVTRARLQIKALVGGEIRMIPNDGYLDAEMAGDYAGLYRLIQESPGTRAGAAAKLSVVAGAHNHLYRTTIYWSPERPLQKKPN